MTADLLGLTEKGGTGETIRPPKFVVGDKVWFAQPVLGWDGGGLTEEARQRVPAIIHAACPGRDGREPAYAISETSLHFPESMFEARP